ncbi:ebp domain containing protein [Grosmannia clavigera kw1407]|uniref:Ebp domain containing protein n=1 Tax=Grosmannia clavigera (strain kw1407 / UAMH 11150) TaxID=655863 RepID=F0X973_GROCL|nr:ebp domain containing protein [Grosmannia clavigera kw1407]EFX05275.1 ebp domain containing protein [Grosmannia clavigera kw1407]
MAVNWVSIVSALPADLFDQTTLISLASTVAILAAAYGASRLALPATASTCCRSLFIWHAFDALIHFVLEGSYLYHCFFSWMPVADLAPEDYYVIQPHPFLGHGDRIYGPQASSQNPFAQLWMVYARADRRWAGADLGVISLELLTVLVMGPLSCLVCYDLARSRPRANVLMVIIATAELYGGFMTFCPEWLIGNANLNGSNFMYMWIYLVFFNTLWVFIPLYVMYVAIADISDAFSVREAQNQTKKLR